MEGTSEPGTQNARNWGSALTPKMKEDPLTEIHVMGQNWGQSINSRLQTNHSNSPIISLSESVGIHENRDQYSQPLKLFTPEPSQDARCFFVFFLEISLEFSAFCVTAENACLKNASNQLYFWVSTAFHNRRSCFNFVVQIPLLVCEIQCGSPFQIAKLNMFFWVYPFFANSTLLLGTFSEPSGTGLRKSLQETQKKHGLCEGCSTSPLIQGCCPQLFISPHIFSL